jgi:hypothetical protein
VAKHPTTQTWTSEQIEKLETLHAQGASAFRASAALKRPTASVRAKAREIGKPFATIRENREKLCRDSSHANSQLRR